MEFAEFIRTPMVDGVTLHRPHCKPISGTLCVTGHHLILSSRTEPHEELWVKSYKETFPIENDFKNNYFSKTAIIYLRSL